MLFELLLLSWAPLQVSVCKPLRAVSQLPPAF